MKTELFHKINIRGVRWEKANLSKKAFIECHGGLTLIHVVSKALSLSILSCLTGILAALAAIFATGLLGAKSNSYNILLGGFVVSLALSGLVVTFKRGFSAFLGLGITAFAGSGFLILIQSGKPPALLGDSQSLTVPGVAV